MKGVVSFSSAGNRKVENGQGEMSAFTTWLSLPSLFQLLFIKFQIQLCAASVFRKAMLGYHGESLRVPGFWRSTEENDK